jgi:hypothetical protein
MTGAEWGVTQYKHMDHHLRQFGAQPWQRAPRIPSTAESAETGGKRVGSFVSDGNESTAQSLQIALRPKLPVVRAGSGRVTALWRPIPARADPLQIGDSSADRDCSGPIDPKRVEFHLPVACDLSCLMMNPASWRS